MNTQPEPKYSNEYIMLMLKRIEERIKKVEKRTKELSWGIPLMFIAFAIGFWLGFG